MAKPNAVAGWVSADKLKPWSKNPRKNQPVKEVAASIKRLGWGAVILARRDGTVVAGHTRLKAHRLLVSEVSHRDDSWHPDAVYAATHDVVPVRYGDWSDSDAELLAVADNKIGELAEWDGDKLADVLGSQSIASVQFSGFSLDELASLTGHSSSDSDSAGGGSSTGGMGRDLVYKVVVTCADEDAQAELLTRLEEEGLECQPLIS